MATLYSRLRSLALSSLLVLAGTALTGTEAQALTCPASQVKDGGLCYAKPRDGYSCHATLCVANCPEGYNSSGIGTCHYSGTLTYTQKPYVTRSHSSMQRCLALFYNDCRSGYRMNVCGICSYGGAWDTTRHSYDRGPGSNPDANAAFNRISDTTRATWGKALQGVENAYQDALAAFNGLDDVLKQALLKQARSNATQLVRDNKDCVKKLQASLDAMTQDTDTANTMKRLVANAAARTITPDNLVDLTSIVRRLPKCSPKQYPQDVTISVYAGYAAAAGAGLSGTVGVMAGLTLGSNDPKPEIYAFVTTSTVLGAIGEAGGLGIALAAGRPQAGTQNFIAGGVDLADEGGAKASIGFGVPTKLPPFDLANITDPAAVANWVLALLNSAGVSLDITGEIGEMAGLPFEFGKQTSYRLY